MISATEREWLEYAVAHMLDDSEPEDKKCAEVLQRLLDRTALMHSTDIINTMKPGEVLVVRPKGPILGEWVARMNQVALRTGIKIVVVDAEAHTLEQAVDRAMNASIPGGSQAWVWLFNCEGGMAPQDKHREWFRRVLQAALR